VAAFAIAIESARIALANGGTTFQDFPMAAASAHLRHRSGHPVGIERRIGRANR